MNTPHENEDQRFVIQAWSNVDGWQNTKHSEWDLHRAIESGRALKRRDDSWMSGDYERQVRIHDREGLIQDINIP